MDILILISTYPVAFWATLLSIAFYWYGTWTHDYFSSQGIPGPRPIPFIGNMWGIWKKNVAENDTALYKKYGKIFGIYEGLVPNLFITDPDLIRSVLIKDSDRFINRRDFTLRTKFLRKMITVVRGQEWKDIRSSVTPTFTIAKIKKMSLLMKQCADNLSRKFASIAETEGKLDVKNEFCTYPVDVISLCAFATKIDLDDKENLFVTNAKKVLISPTTKSPLILLLFLFPKLIKALRSRILIIKEYEYFKELVLNVVKQRSTTSERFNDFIETAYETFSGATVDGSKTVKWTREEVDELVIGQCIVFLFAGFDSVSTTLTSTTFLLATNPDVQEKLYELIMEKLEQYGDVCHNMLLDMPYLDQILNESLRMYSPAPRLERECNEDVTYNGVHIRKGTLVTIPIYAVHYSEEFFPNPDKFDPDRWDPASENKPNPYSFLSFGFGPRNCVGMKFALEEVKIALCTLLRKFEFFPVPETPDKMHMDFGFLIGNQPTNAIVGVKVRPEIQ